MARKVLTLAEVRDGALRNVSFEAIAAAKRSRKAERLFLSLSERAFAH